VHLNSMHLKTHSCSVKLWEAGVWNAGYAPPCSGNYEGVEDNRLRDEVRLMREDKCKALTLRDRRKHHLTAAYVKWSNYRLSHSAVACGRGQEKAALERSVKMMAWHVFYFAYVQQVFMAFVVLTHN